LSTVGTADRAADADLPRVRPRSKEAREILRIGVFYDTVEETLAANGFAANAKGRQSGPSSTPMLAIPLLDQQLASAISA
jgi:hypothetical protein